MLRRHCDARGTAEQHREHDGTGTACGRTAHLIPRHLCQHHRHAAGIGDAREDEAGADERRQGVPGRIDELTEDRTEHDQSAGADPHLAFQRHHLPAAAGHFHPGCLTGRGAPFDAHHVVDTGRDHLFAGLLAAATRLADEIERVAGLPGMLGGDGTRIEAIERNVAGAFDVHLVVFGGGPHVNQRHPFSPTAEIGKRIRGNRGNHGSTSVGITRIRTATSAANQILPHPARSLHGQTFPTQPPIPVFPTAEMPWTVGLRSL